MTNEKIFKERKRVSALIIEDKKLLLVIAKNTRYYFTPGGGIKRGESTQNALRRELKEELSVEVIDFRPYLNYEYMLPREYKLAENENILSKVSCYLVKYRGKIIPKNEIQQIFWCSRKNFESGEPKIGIGTRKYIIPKLIEDKLL